MDRSYEAFLIEDDGVFPNNDRLAVTVYQQVFVAEAGKGAARRPRRQNGRRRSGRCSGDPRRGKP